MLRCPPLHRAGREAYVSKVVILGVFLADAAFRAERLPRLGETLHGSGFALGPGGKGSNQAVAAARAGAKTHFITRLGTDNFGDMAVDLWRRAGVEPVIERHAEHPTGAAFIFIEAHSGNNAIIISPGVAETISVADIEAQQALISGADVFVTQFEQPLPPARRALEIAREGKALTILNPAPATDISNDLLALCDIVTPNETEAELLTGVKVVSIADAQQAAMALVARGAGAAIITLGEKGALYNNGAESVHVSAVNAGAAVDTTGAGDAFNGALAAALARKWPAERALRYASAAAAISVTRHGTAPAMASDAEINALLERQ
ncbi:ribokinase [Pseudohoeflea sp. DP4N28-3]|uniref:Ribokinase n=1 Tax=Pseudohoeflea coraliihabitans TaxID=2860393 RepID=A0ABS6WNH3_9HYPH|nr:ribokinase [Pseudohoeflea sp. DP4N28-3]